jgi:hypothetical protein
VNGTCDQDQLKRELQVKAQKFRPRRKEHVVLRDVIWSRKKKKKFEKSRKKPQGCEEELNTQHLLGAELRHYPLVGDIEWKGR